MGNYKRGTAIGRRMQQQADTHALKTLGWGTAGLVVGGASAAYGLMSGDVFGSTAGVSTGATMVEAASQHARKAHDGWDRANAVDSLIAKSRGGSAALGQHGIVPKRRVGPQSSLTPDDMAKFAHASHQFAASKNVASQADATNTASGKRGWSNKARIASAQARGVQTLPYGGNPDEDA